MGANFDTQTKPEFLKGPIVVSRDLLFTIINQKKSTWNYIWVNVFSFFPPVCFTLLSFFVANLFSNWVLQKDNLGHGVESQGHVAQSHRVACVCPLRISIFYWNHFVSFSLSASLVSIFQIASLPTQQSWPTSNLSHLSNLSIYSQQLGAWN